MITNVFGEFPLVLGLFVAFNAFVCRPSSGAVVFVDSVHREYNFLEVDPLVPFERDDYDLNGDGITDFWIDYSQFVFQVVPSGESRVGATEIISGIPPSVLSFWSALVMEDGDEIGAILGENWMPRIEKLDSFGETELIGAWLNNSVGEAGPLSDVHPGYIGIEFSIDSETHYGWVAIENSPEEHLVSGRLTGWAYETIPGKSITAGAIPEPSTGILVILGVAAIAARGGRRRSSKER